MEVIPDTNAIDTNDCSTGIKRIQPLTPPNDISNPNSEIIETSADVWIFFFFFFFEFCLF
jgi:hypothetical protein